MGWRSWRRRELAMVNGVRALQLIMEMAQAMRVLPQRLRGPVTSEIVSVKVSAPDAGVVAEMTHRDKWSWVDRYKAVVVAVVVAFVIANVFYEYLKS
jgi:hypothetical protein